MHRTCASGWSYAGWGRKLDAPLDVQPATHFRLAAQRGGELASGWLRTKASVVKTEIRNPSLRVRTTCDKAKRCSLLPVFQAILCVLLLSAAHSARGAAFSSTRTNSGLASPGSGSSRSSGGASRGGVRSTTPSVLGIPLPEERYGPNTMFEDLAEGLRSKVVYIRVEAIRATYSTNRPYAKATIPLLVESLVDDGFGEFTRTERSRLRSEASMALGMLGPQAKAAIPALVQVMNDTDERARANAIEAIKRVQPLDKRAMPVLINAMRDPSTRVQNAANLALVEVGPVSSNVVSAFIRAVSRNAAKIPASPRDFKVGDIPPPGDIRTASYDFFQLLGPEQRYAVPELTALADDPNAPIPVKRLAFMAMNNIGEVPAKYLPFLLSSLPDDLAWNSLRIMGPKAKDATAELIPFLDKKETRPIAADILAAIGAPGATSAIPAFERNIRQTASPELYMCEDLLKIAPSSQVALDGFEKIASKPLGSTAERLSGAQLTPEEVVALIGAPNAAAARPKAEELLALLDVPSIMVAHARLAQGNRAPRIHMLYLAGKLKEPSDQILRVRGEVAAGLQCAGPGPQQRGDPDA